LHCSVSWWPGPAQIVFGSPIVSYPPEPTLPWCTAIRVWAGPWLRASCNAAFVPRAPVTRSKQCKNMDCKRGLRLPPRGCGVAVAPCRWEPTTRCSRWSRASPSLRITLILKALPAKSSSTFAERLLSNSAAVRFCLPWNPDSGNFRRSGRAGRLSVLSWENQKYGGNQWPFVADVERRSPTV